MDNETIDHLSIQIDEELNVLSPISSNHSIFQIPEQLRNVNKEAYEPFIVAIGPYHRNKERLMMMEEHKKWYLKMLLQRRGENDVNKYVAIMRALEVRARNCYATEFVNLKTDDFVKMLLFDSCFIIEILRKNFEAFVSNDHNTDDPILGVPLIHHAVLNDLVLLENQLPFIVLWEFFRVTLMPNEKENHLVSMIDAFFIRILPKGNSPKLLMLANEESIQNIKHLLALLYNGWCPSSSETKKDWEFIRCATELKEAGIKFKKVERGSLFEVKFEKGVMEIPRLEISDNTERVIRNLIAYEQFFLDKNINYVTDYVRFMDCLINSPEDVELLCQCGIIHNWLGDDEVIANMFNRVGVFVVITRRNFYYSDLFNKVNKHCSNHWNKRMAILRHKYFNTPWALISFLAASLLLFLTFAQTVFSGMSINK